MTPTFPAALLAWFTKNMRPLPWRTDYAPYHVWISEIMLQQTQMDRGVEYFNKWIHRFPDVAAVAQANERDILAAWEGLGYYSRARNLHKAAKQILEKHKGKFPSAHTDIRALPGIGDYTAGAISSIAFGEPHPAVDANVLRIFARLDDIAAPVTSPNTRQQITERVQALTPPDKARDFCQALMELGALVCTKRPRCEICPVAHFCLAQKNGTTTERPVQKSPTAYKNLETVAALLLRTRRGAEEVFLRQRPPTGLWPGLWEFPGGDIAAGESPEDALVRHLSGVDAGGLEKIGTVRHGYTTHRVTLHGYRVRLGKTVAVGMLDARAAGSAGEWLPRATLDRYAFPAGHKKLLQLLGWKEK
jgi:A/G-specific adenine glycosylase